MKTVLPFVYKTAKVISILGHPLLTISLFSVYITFRHLPLKNAVIISGLLIGGVIIPISWYSYRKVNQGQYTNFDVSNQRQRAQFYPVLIGLVALLAGLLFATNQARPFSYGTVCVLLLLVSSYGVNRYIKVSLHTSLSFFLTWAIYSISESLALAMGIFSILIAASRIILKRHTLAEILVGALIGSVTGIGLHMILTLS